MRSFLLAWYSKLCNVAVRNRLIDEPTDVNCVWVSCSAIAGVLALILVCYYVCRALSPRARSPGRSPFAPMKARAVKRRSPSSPFCPGTSARITPQELAKLFAGAGAIQTLERVLWCAPTIIVVVVSADQHKGSLDYCDLWLFVSEEDALTSIRGLGGDTPPVPSRPSQILTKLSIDDVKHLCSQWAPPPWVVVAPSQHGHAHTAGNDGGTAKGWISRAVSDADQKSWQQVMDDERERQRNHVKVGVWSDRHRTELC